MTAPDTDEVPPDTEPMPPALDVPRVQWARSARTHGSGFSCGCTRSPYCARVAALAT